MRHVHTARLTLSPAGLDDLEPMAALHADARVWTHLPTGRHTDVEQTRAYLLERERQWRQDDAGNPDASAVRLIFTDRRLGDAQLEAVTRLH